MRFIKNIFNPAQGEPPLAIPALYDKQLTPQLQNGGIKSFYMAPALRRAAF